MNKGQISNPSIQIKPSQQLIDYIKTVQVSSELPEGIANIIFKNKKESNRKSFEPKLLITDEDRNFLKKLELSAASPNSSVFKLPVDCRECSGVKEEKLFLNLQDLHWLYDYIQNNDGTSKVYLHELLENSQVILPENKKIPRNPVLQKRCEKLKVSQQNKEYNDMTKNVDSIRRRHPEDTIAYQIKQMNRHLIVISQFILSVIAGFAFGFIGVELIIGNLDFGFRLLLGIICALIIALAELYFLAKKLNEDLQFEVLVTDKSKSVKVD